MGRQLRYVGLGVVLVLGLGWGAAPSFAGGVAIVETGSGLGNAQAGQAAAAQDASTVWWNPAGMTVLKRRQLVGSAHLILPSGTFTDEGSISSTGGPLLGGDGGDGGVMVPVPSLFAVVPWGDRMRFGISINSPFGLRSDWGDDWIGRYHATNSELTTININPAISVKLDRRWSLGVGLNLQYAQATLENAIDGGLIDATQLGGALGFTPQQNDGFVDVTGDNWGIGWNVGLMVEPDRCSRIGLHYRSKIEHELEGEADFSGMDAIAAATAGARFVDTDARVDLTMPDTLSLSYFRQLNRKWSVLADVTWTGWSSFDAANIEFDNPTEPDNTLALDWNDTMRYSLGLIYQTNCRWTCRFGVAYDESPIPDETRTPRIPGNDRLWVAAGLGYQLHRNLQVNASYAHLFIDDGDVDRTTPAAGRLFGHTENSVDIVGVSFVLDF